MKKILYFILSISFCCNVYAQIQCLPTSIIGFLKYDNIVETPLGASQVYLENLTGTIIDSCVTDLSGFYHFCNIPYGIYHLRAKTNIPWGGVNAIDALMALQYFLHQITLTELRFRASDVNLNSYVNSVDALAILERFVGMNNFFSIGDWVFDHQQVIISDTLTQIVDIKGLCTGDLDASYVPFNQSFVNCGDTLTDQRDMQKYPTVLIGNQCWMQANLNMGIFVMSIGSTNPHSDCSNNDIIQKYCYNNDVLMCSVYGGLYDWNEMMQYDTLAGIKGICPSGWHIPTDSDWCILTSFLDPSVNCGNIGWSGINAGGKLKESGITHWGSPNTGATNTSGFTAFGSGDRTINGYFGAMNVGATFWTSTKMPGNKGIWWSMGNTKSSIYRGNNSQVSGLSVRCIR